MTFLAPVFFYIGLAVAAGTVALHFIVTRQPASSPLPTVRFIPVSAVRVTTIAPVPEDLWVLLARVLAALLIGAAFARPMLVPDRRPVARVVLADISRGVARIEEVRDSARSLVGAGDALIVFDSAPRLVEATSDSIAGLRQTDTDARLSPALIVAMRAASEMRETADSIELVVISPFRQRSLDGATHGIRTLWPGRVRLVAVAPSADSVAPPAGVTVRADAGDGVALAAAGLAADDSSVRIVRGAGTTADSIWATGGRRTLVRWPASGAPPGWGARLTIDTIGAVIAGDAALVYPLERRWAPDSSLLASRAIVARWVDGQPAAIEHAAGTGCIRDVAIPVPARGDVVLRTGFARLVRALGAPCQRIMGSRAMTEADLRALAGSGPLASREAIAPPESISTPLVPWLLTGALLMVLLEIWIRRGSAPMWKDEEAEEPIQQRGAA